MNSFHRFGIDHLSPSSLNTWRTAPGIWALRYIAKMTDKGNAAMWRGSAVEDGLKALLLGKDIEAAIALAHQSFDMNAQGEASDENIAEHELISPMVRQCQNWKAPGPIAATQLKIEYRFEHIPIPVIGWLDFAFMEPAIDIDCKSTKAIPSAPRADHVRQVSLYRAARGRAGGVLYVSSKRHAYYDIGDDDMERALGDMHNDALSLNNFLAKCDTKQEIMRSLPIDWDHFQAPKIKVPLAEILLAG